jgi:hypothetical protein
MYYVSKDGIFGTYVRSYVSDLTGEECIIVQWGPLNWITPVLKKEVHFLYNIDRLKAEDEAEKWLDEIEKEEK